MFLSVGHFVQSWEAEMNSTIKLMEILTDKSLKQPEHNDIRNIGRVAWHIVTTIPEMMEKIGIDVGGPTEKDPIPTQASEIVAAYRKHATSLLNAVKRWKDEDMFVEDEMYGEKWQRGITLWILIKHEIHHRGQMTIMMRLAGLPVAGVYGPAREEWSKFGMEIPEL
ncbi:MAG: DinB family protein [candidate division Zixibacteria bacterium]